MREVREIDSKETLERAEEFAKKIINLAAIGEKFKETLKMRKNLKRARRMAGMTQSEMAKYLRISIRSYQRIESGEFIGKICHWDALEDFFNLHQRLLREDTKI